MSGRYCYISSRENAGLSATATLLPDMWSWAANTTWFPKVQAAALAAHQRCTITKGQVVSATAKSKIVEFLVTADHGNPNPICAIVVSATLNGELSGYNFISADLSYCDQSLQKDIRDSPKNNSLGLKLYTTQTRGQRVASRLFDYHEEDKVTRMLNHLTEDKDPTGTSLFLRISTDEWNAEILELGVEFVLDIYKGPLS